MWQAASISGSECLEIESCPVAITFAAQLTSGSLNGTIPLLEEQVFEIIHVDRGTS